MKWLVTVSLCVGCASDPTPTGPIAVGGCGGMTENIDSQPATHVAVGTSISWTTNPPATGTHYPVWAAYDRAYEALDRGFYVHDLEHGAIVFLYNCVGGSLGCPDIVAGLEAIVRAMPIDPAVTAPIRQRALITGDAQLPEGITVAAVAWDNLYTATCVDPYLKTFASNHYGFGPEKVPDNGADFGGTFIDATGSGSGSGSGSAN